MNRLKVKKVQTKLLYFRVQHNIFCVRGSFKLKTFKPRMTFCKTNNKCLIFPFLYFKQRRRRGISVQYRTICNIYEGDVVLNHTK